MREQLLNVSLYAQYVLYISAVKLFNLACLATYETHFTDIYKLFYNVHILYVYLLVHSKIQCQRYKKLI